MANKYYGAIICVQVSNLGLADVYIVKINQNLTNLIKRVRPINFNALKIVVEFRCYREMSIILYNLTMAKSI
jgi:hypothetical protein